MTQATRKNILESALMFIAVLGIVAFFITTYVQITSMKAGIMTMHSEVLETSDRVEQLSHHEINLRDRFTGTEGRALEARLQRVEKQLDDLEEVEKQLKQAAAATAADAD